VEPFSVVSDHWQNTEISAIARLRCALTLLRCWPSTVFLALGSHYAAAVSGESSQFSPDEVRTYTAAISTDAASTLIDKISVAAVAIHNQTGNEREMKILQDLAPLPDGGRYREVAGKLRVVARQCNFPNARQEILNLAMRYEGMSRERTISIRNFRIRCPIRPVPARFLYIGSMRMRDNRRVGVRTVLRPRRQ